MAQLAIWAVFAADFFTRLAFADNKLRYLRHNWVAGIAVALPALRVFRVLRAARALRGLRLARLLTGTSRGARTVRRFAGKGGASYVLGLSAIVLLLAAAGIRGLERGAEGATLTSFSEGLWWAAATMTTIGTGAEPVTAEGRILAVFLMVYGLAVSGYVTALLAVVLLGFKAPGEESEEIARLREEVTRLRQELEAPPQTRP